MLITNHLHLLYSLSQTNTNDICHISGAKNVPSLTYFLAFQYFSISFPAEIDLSTIAQDQPALDTLDLTSCSKCAYLLLPFSEDAIVYDTATGSLGILCLTITSVPCSTWLSHCYQVQHRLFICRTALQHYISIYRIYVSTYEAILF